eukprot:gnl/MRDRNA2_/MRDRNA2_82242_c0_seq1.p1 gnl/MRDRNA2_/MRDRNA2_82242_c0~~gnl/MRDRNA2_/MRDRNA2_82242_c0_seq1.p1  ORF type:complete len:134 (-),score=27.73 gnl/MRDRNA2_/MRDRNA2_82242_c0_seq1:208-561(-)
MQAACYTLLLVTGALAHSAKFVAKTSDQTGWHLYDPDEGRLPTSTLLKICPNPAVLQDYKVQIGCKMSELFSPDGPESEVAAQYDATKIAAFKMAMATDSPWLFPAAVYPETGNMAS